MKRLFVLLSLLFVGSPAFAAAVNITTVTTAGGNETVTTSSAHGLAVNQLGCIGSSSVTLLNQCFVVATVPTSTTFTFAGANVCAATCGSVSPGKQIIVLTKPIGAGTDASYVVLFWFPIKNNPLPQAQGSAWTALAGSIGPTTQEQTAIQSGIIKEEQQNFTFPVGSPIAAIEAILQQWWVNRNGQINVQGPAQFFGSYFDGGVWGAQ